jgi:hypothetical protein
MIVVQTFGTFPRFFEKIPVLTQKHAQDKSCGTGQSIGTTPAQRGLSMQP